MIGEGHPITEKLSYSQLRSEVSAWAAALKSLGVEKGDVVAGILPNCIQVVNNNLSSQMSLKNFSNERFINCQFNPKRLYIGLATLGLKM